METDCIPDSEITVDSFILCKMLSRIINKNDVKYEINGDKKSGRNIENAVALMT